MIPNPKLVDDLIQHFHVRAKKEVGKKYNLEGPQKEPA